MLTQVLTEIQAAQGPITIGELSRKMAVDPQALEGIIQFWVRKGRIQDDAHSNPKYDHGCSSSCSGPVGCTFIAKMPKSYSLSSNDKSEA